MAAPAAVREAMHDVARGDAAECYRLELARRQWVRVLGATRCPGREDMPTRPRSVELPRLRRGEMHLAYSFTADHLLCYVATADGVTLEEIPGSRVDWHDRVLALRKLLQGGDSTTAALEQRIRSVRTLDGLLPTRVRTAPDLRRLYISPDGPLGAIPFEALDLAPIGDAPGVRSYVPAGARLEIATLRGVRHPSAVSTHVSILADPDPGRDEQLRYPELGPLPKSLAEAESTSSLWPAASVITGRGATERALLEDWKDAGVIEIAAHLVRLREIPFYEYIPLAPSTGVMVRDQHAD